MIYVVDASVAVGWFFREADEQDPDFLLDASIERIAPDLVFSEVANVLQRKVRSGQLNLQQAERALATLPLSLDRIVSRKFCLSGLSIFQENSITPYTTACILPQR